MQIQKNAIPNVKLLLLGNKLDLEENRQVKTDDVKELCDPKGISWLDVSAKSGENVPNAF